MTSDGAVPAAAALPTAARTTSRVPRAARLTPPAPVPPRSDLSSLALVRIARDNTLKTWPARAYEDLVVHRRLFGKNCYLVNDPVAVRHILSEDGAVYERPISVRRIIFPFARGGLVVAEGNERLRHRRTLAPAFTPHQVERLLPRFVEASTAMLGLLGSGGRANLAAILGRVTLDAAGRALFSVPLVDRAERMAQLLHDYFGRAARGTLWDALAQFLLANEIGSWQFGSARGALGRQWAAEVEAIINERRAALPSGEAAADVLGLLLAARDPESGAPLPDAEVRIQVSSMLAAGFDTTARALFWTVYLLSRDRDEQARVRAEIDRFPPGAVKSLADLDKWPSLGRVLLEALRLYPTISVFGRLLRTPDAAPGIEMEAGSLVMISPWVMHRHRRFWDAPNSFVPERFEGPARRHFAHGAYIPFGGGRRACLGGTFALTEATIILAHLLDRFEITLDDDRPVMPVAIVTTTPSVEPYFLLRPRG